MVHPTLSLDTIFFVLTYNFIYYEITANPSLNVELLEPQEIKKKKEYKMQ